MNNNKLLYGKIVKFIMNLDDIIKKINEIEECRIENRTKYTLTTIWTNKTFGVNTLFTKMTRNILKIIKIFRNIFIFIFSIFFITIVFIMIFGF